MPAVRAQIILHTVDAFPANYVTNSIAFIGTDPVADATAITTHIKTFYDTWRNTYMSSAIAQNGHEVKFYDLPGVMPNYPVLETTFNLAAAPAATPLPSELAICVSFNGQRVPGFPQARRRGRIYCGPLGTNANSNGRPAAAFITAMTGAASAFKASIDGMASDTEWAIWSVADQTGVDIVGGWVDNCFDVQRRRGIEETSRTTWS